MPISNLYVIMARSIVTDDLDHMTSINKIIERFNFTLNQGEGESEPMLLPASYFIGTSWFFGSKLKKDTFINLTIIFITPDNQAHQGPAQEQLIPAGIDRANAIFNLDALPVTVSGKYILKVEMSTKDLKLLASGQYPFDVSLNGDPI
jgi:hypothetical protein